jgi:folate-binding protein YgfZ
MTSGAPTTSVNRIRDQYLALRDGRGFVELVGWSSITVTGADRQAFLHSFCTNDIKRHVPGQSCEAFFTNVKGRTIGYGLVACRETELVFIAVPGQGPSLVEHLDRYVIREDVQLRDTTAERSYVLLSDASVQIGDVPVRWIRWDLIGRPSSGLVEVASADLARARQAIEERGATPCDMAAFETLRIEAGTPLFGIDFNDTNLPQELGRDDRAISFTKGCYLGQETVARIDALGHVNQQLAGVRFSGTDVPQAGAALVRAGASAGHVTSGTFSPRLGAPLALAMVKRDSLAPGTALESQLTACKVVALPIGDASK